MSFFLVLRSCTVTSQPHSIWSEVRIRYSDSRRCLISVPHVTIPVTSHIRKDEALSVTSDLLVHCVSPSPMFDDHYPRVVRRGIGICALGRQRLPCVVTSRLSCTCETPDTAMRNHSSSSSYHRTCISSHSHFLYTSVFRPACRHSLFCIPPNILKRHECRCA
jgi:hypothetical protein